MGSGLLQVLRKVALGLIMTAWLQLIRFPVALIPLLFSHFPLRSRSPTLHTQIFEPRHPHVSHLSSSRHHLPHRIPPSIARTAPVQDSSRGVASLPICTPKVSSRIQTSMAQGDNRMLRYIHIIPRPAGKVEAAMTLTTRVETRVFAPSQNVDAYSRT